MKAILNQLTRHEALSKQQARQILINIAEGAYNNSQITAFLTVYMMRSISLEELEGFRMALLELCRAVDLSGSMQSIYVAQEVMKKTPLIFQL